MPKFTAVAALLLFAGSAIAQPGNPADMYLLSDASNEVYQYSRTSPWPYVPGTYPGIAKPLVFSNTSQVGGINPYLGAVAGTNNDFYIGGFGGLRRVDGNTGAFVANIAGGQRLGPAKAPNGNVVVGGPGGIEEYNSNTGAFVRNVNGFGDGSDLFCFSGPNMFTTPWNAGSFVIKEFDFVSGLPSGPDIAVPFNPQKLAIGPDGALYASALYESPAYEGIYRYNGSAWTLFVNTNTQAGGGPHAFAWDPANLNNLFVTQNSGEIFRFDGFSGAYLNTIDTVPTKLTDILFKTVAPSPGVLVIMGMGGIMATRRRR